MITKNKKIVIVSVLILIGVMIALFIIYKEKKVIQWSPENSLMPADSAPEINDKRDSASLITAIDQSLVYLNRVDPNTSFNFGSHRFKTQKMIESLVCFKTKLQETGLTPAFFKYVKDNYVFYRSGSDEVLFTGYYEASLRGSCTSDSPYDYPLYQVPEDLVSVDLSRYSFYSGVENRGVPKLLRGRLTRDNRIVPYYSRSEIDSGGCLTGRNLELVWIDSAIDVFFLHIQGSGIVRLDDGRTMRVNFAGTNGHPYLPIGRLMIERNLLSRETVSMQSIRAYLESHPSEVEEILNYNPSYVFFRQVEEGPMGCLDVPVTAYRSIATDKSLFPGGALVYIETGLPVFSGGDAVRDWERFSGFVLNQDTGGAIRTPGRVDLFMGYGPESELIAGHMKQKGTFYFLIKK